MDRVLGAVPIYMLVLARMAGAIGVNPMLNRKNVPIMVRVALVLLLTWLIAPGMALQQGGFTERDLIFQFIKELCVGLACGFVFQVFYYMLFFTGDLMDTHFGMAMAKVFDPGTSIQMSISSNWLNILFIFYIFVTNSHLLMIRIFATSFQIVPIGQTTFTPHVLGFVLDLFIEAFSLALRLALPFVAMEFVLDLSMGILMKLIPQIHVFVISIQCKVLLGISMLLIFAVPVGGYLDRYMNLMFENMQKAFFTFA
ncbi:MAG: flagellar biosynthetic protein FliR [Anaerotruncus sp.]|nr:flagellar biosynthetic protein FliR [Anaerotruncus sp.]